MSESITRRVKPVPLGIERVGYIVQDNGTLKPIDRRAQQDFGRRMLELAKSLNRDTDILQPK